MSTVSSGITPAAGGSTVADVLIPLHDGWFRGLHRHLAPLLAGDTEFWARWPATRFLSDQFEDWFRHERDLVRSVASTLHPSDIRRLEQSAAAVASGKEELDVLSRRKTDGKTTDAARRFFARLELWRTEVECALAEIPCERLCDEDRRLLKHLETLSRSEGR